MYWLFLLTPLREGRHAVGFPLASTALFLLTPLREGRRGLTRGSMAKWDISTHAPAGGATQSRLPSPCWCRYFYSRPCGRGDRYVQRIQRNSGHFYSRPCGRGDVLRTHHWFLHWLFLLTPLREGRRTRRACKDRARAISTHAPAGGAT